MKDPAAVALGAKGGKVKSEKKTVSSRENAKKALAARMAKRMSERDESWNGPMSDPNAGSNGLYSTR